MTVYVDSQYAYGQIVRGSRALTGEWSRLLADDPAELAEFALNLGLLPEWVRAPGTPAECYDVGEVTRRRAIAAGAVPISFPRGTANVIATKTLQAAALDAARRGWHVFPLRPGTKVPAVRHWEHEAILDPEQIRQLWTADLRRRDGWFVPEPRNLGIACGPSELVVLDLDVPKTDDRTGWADHWRSHGITSGAQVLDTLAEQAGQALPHTYAVATPSGGRHLYFTAPDEVHVRNSAGRVGPMVDVRGEGGYVVGPGSRIHPHYYEPHNDTIDHGEPGYQLITDLDPITLPGWIADAATAGRNRDDQPDTDRRPDHSQGRSVGSRSDGYGAAALRGEVDRVRSAPVGQRNHTLNGAAYSLGQLVAAGALDHTDAVDALTDAAQTAGLTSAEIAATIYSGLRAGANNPRVLPPARAQHDGEAGRASAGLDQPEQAVGTRQDSDRADAKADLDRVFGLEPAVAVPIVAGLIIDAPPDERPVVLRDAATWIARLIDDDGTDGTDGQYALDALSAAARRTGMTKTEIDTTVAAGITQTAAPADLVDPIDDVEESTAQTTTPDPMPDRTVIRDTPQLSTGGAEVSVEGSALNEPVDADALVRVGTLQTRGVIDRAAWDATVTAVANRSAAVDRHQADGLVDQAQLSEGIDRNADRPVGQAPSAPAPEQLLDGPGSAETPIVDPEPAPMFPEGDSDPHQALDDAIGQARAVVEQLGSAPADHRRRSRDAAADTVREVRDDRPAYWAEPEVDL